MKYLKIEANRDSYAPEGETLTVGQLIELLENFDKDLPIYLSHDKGYTYGRLSEERITKTNNDDFVVYAYEDDNGEKLVLTKIFYDEDEAINYAESILCKYSRVEVIDYDTNEKIY